MANKNLKKKKGALSSGFSHKVRFPRGDEFIGVVEQRLGGSRMRIRKMDGSQIMAQIPGAKKRSLWIRENDIVLLKPWEIEKEKADLIYKFNPGEVRKLKTKGMISSDLESVEEF